jgi:hypothetical protein
VAITEDASTPGATTGIGAAPTITSASFTPPANRLIVAMVCGEWSHGTVTQVISDSRGLTWQLMAIATGTKYGCGVTAIYCTYVTSSAAMTVTATFTGLAGGRFLDIRVLAGADPDQSASTGWAQVKTTLVTGNGSIAVTTTEVGSVVYGMSGSPYEMNTLNPLGGTTVIAQHVNNVDDTGVASWKYTTAAAGAVTLGGTWAEVTTGILVAFEVLPLGGSVPSPVMPTFIDGMVPRAADLSALAFNIRNLFTVAGGGLRYAPYVPGGKGPIKPLTVLGITNPNFGVASGALTFMVFDTPYANSDNAWNVLAPSIILFNTGGLYRLHFQVQFLSIDYSDIETIVVVNGTSPTSNGVAISNEYGKAGGCSTSVRVAAGSFAYCGAIQNSGTPATMGATQFVAEYLGA